MAEAAAAKGGAMEATMEVAARAGEANLEARRAAAMVEEVVLAVAKGAMVEGVPGVGRREVRMVAEARLAVMAVHKVQLEMQRDEGD